jgi:poly(A) polymerase
MLRAIRFASVCGWKIAPETWDAIRAEAQHLGCVSMERIRTEFIRTLCETPQPSLALEMFHKSGLLARFFPELISLRNCLQDPIWHPEGDVWQHTVKMLELLPPKRSPELVWSVLLHDIGKPKALIVDVKPDGSPWYRTPNHAAIGARMVEPILRRFKESLTTIERVTVAVRQHMQFVELPRMRESTIRQMLGRATIQLELELHRLDCLSSHSKLDLYHLAQQRLADFANEPVLPPPALTGKDLVTLGFKPGPMLGKRLKKAYDQQLEGATRETLLANALLEAPGHSNRAKKIAFVLGKKDKIPLLSAWEQRHSQPSWQAALIVLPGVSWAATRLEHAQLYRIVTDCAGNADYPPANTFDLLIVRKEDAEPALLASARRVITL